MNTKARLIAYYLPQFHPLPENDKYWGKGFTEWTNVAKAKPLFQGHYQPHLPTEFGYYDLRIPEVRKEQAELAKQYGIEGFCYWHYWFGGKRVLERPFDEVVKSGEPEFPFCLCWANHPWTATWIGDTKTVIFDQTYPGIEDDTNHFYALLPAFKDKRYIKTDGKLVFSLFGPRSITHCKEFTETWQKLAYKEGLPGFYFIGMGAYQNNLEEFGLDACVEQSPHSLLTSMPIQFKDKISYRIFGKNFVESKAKILKKPKVYSYQKLVELYDRISVSPGEYPIIFPNWDHTPRSGNRGLVIQGSTPQLFGQMLKHAIDLVKDREPDKRLVFIKAWNEWAEGNYLEPEKKYGRGYLEEIKKINVIQDSV